MKKIFLILLAAVCAILAIFLSESSFFISGSSEVIRFEPEETLTDGFHEIKAAEKACGGVIYYRGEKIVYEKEGADGDATELADGVSSLWRDGSDLYYNSNDTLYKHDLRTGETKKMAEKPYIILGKYNGNIISYHGKNIYSINEAGKTKVFRDGYYLNRAVLYQNKVYGIPATNVYAYNLDTLQVEKVTDNPEFSSLEMIGGELYVVTGNKSMGKRSFTYSKVADGALREEFTVRNVEMIAGEKHTAGGIFLAASKSYNDSTRGDMLLYVEDGKKIKVDKNYSYEIVGIIDNRLCYYKNKYRYGTDDENLTAFYLYDGKKSRPAFDLDVGYFETIGGCEYEDGLLIEINYESSTDLYKYDGEKVERIETPDSFYRIIDLDVVDGKAYIRYSEGEEAMEVAGTVIDLGR